MSRPERAILVAGILLLSFASFNISQTYLQDRSPSESVKAVLGASDQDDARVKSERVDTYRSSVQAQLTFYLNKRAIYMQSLEAGDDSAAISEAWQRDLEFFRMEVLDLVVPGAYQDLHFTLALIVSEEQALLESAGLDMESIFRGQALINRSWASLLQDYEWLETR